MTKARRSLPIAPAVLGALLLASCGGSSVRRITPSQRLVPVPGSSVGQIILSPAGAQRIGIQTAMARRVPALPAPPAPRPTTKLVLRAGAVVKVSVPAPRPRPRPSPLRAIVPVGAVVYDPSGKTYVFTSPGALKYTEVPVSIDHYTGSSVYLRTGPRPGTAVVTVGAEELYGVQTGVLAQT